MQLVQTASLGVVRISSTPHITTYSRMNEMFILQRSTGTFSSSKRTSEYSKLPPAPPTIMGVGWGRYFHAKRDRLTSILYMGTTYARRPLVRSFPITSIPVTTYTTYARSPFVRFRSPPSLLQPMLVVFSFVSYHLHTRSPFVCFLSSSSLLQPMLVVLSFFSYHLHPVTTYARSPFVCFLSPSNLSQLVFTAWFGYYLSSCTATGAFIFCILFFFSNEHKNL